MTDTPAPAAPGQSVRLRPELHLGPGPDDEHEYVRVLGPDEDPDAEGRPSMLGDALTVALTDDEAERARRSAAALKANLEAADRQHREALDAFAAAWEVYESSVGSFLAERYRQSQQARDAAAETAEAQADEQRRALQMAQLDEADGIGGPRTYARVPAAPRELPTHLRLYTQGELPDEHWKLHRADCRTLRSRELHPDPIARPRRTASLVRAAEALALHTGKAQDCGACRPGDALAADPALNVEDRKAAAREQERRDDRSEPLTRKSLIAHLRALHMAWWVHPDRPGYWSVDPGPDPDDRRPWLRRDEHLIGLVEPGVEYGADSPVPFGPVFRQDREFLVERLTARGLHARLTGDRPGEPAGYLVLRNPTVAERRASRAASTRPDPAEAYVTRIAAAIHAALPTAHDARVRWHPARDRHAIVQVRDRDGAVLWDVVDSQPDSPWRQMFSGFYGSRRPWCRQKVADLDEAVAAWGDVAGAARGDRDERGRVLVLPGSAPRGRTRVIGPPDGQPPALTAKRISEAVRACGRPWAPRDASRSGYAVTRTAYLDQNPVRTLGIPHVRRDLEISLYPGEVVVGWRRLAQDWCCPIDDPAERAALIEAMHGRGWAARYSGQRQVPDQDPAEPHWFLIVRQPTAAERLARRSSKETDHA
jgi:hypothetical protein